MDELRKLLPRVGSYVWETDFFQPNWQDAFWGELRAPPRGEGRIRSRRSLLPPPWRRQRRLERGRFCKACRELANNARGPQPLALAYGDGTWTQWGLFQFQTSRPVHYFVYFIMGVAVGAHGLRKGLLSHDGALARRWPIWALAAAGFGALVVFLAVATMTSKGPEQSVFVCASDLAFVPSCATFSFALLAVFTRFVKRSNPMFDSLSANSYGIYIVHYAFVAWLQFALLHASLSGTEKWALVAIAAYAASWLSTAAARRPPGIARII